MTEEEWLTLTPEGILELAREAATSFALCLAAYEDGTEPDPATLDNSRGCGLLALESLCSLRRREGDAALYDALTPMHQDAMLLVLSDAIAELDEGQWKPPALESTEEGNP